MQRLNLRTVSAAVARGDGVVDSPEQVKRGLPERKKEKERRGLQEQKKRK